METKHLKYVTFCIIHTGLSSTSFPFYPPFFSYCYKIHKSIFFYFELWWPMSSWTRKQTQCKSVQANPFITLKMCKNHNQRALVIWLGTCIIDPKHLSTLVPTNIPLETVFFPCCPKIWTLIDTKVADEFYNLFTLFKVATTIPTVLQLNG